MSHLFLLLTSITFLTHNMFPYDIYFIYYYFMITYNIYDIYIYLYITYLMNYHYI